MRVWILVDEYQSASWDPSGWTLTDPHLTNVACRRPGAPSGARPAWTPGRSPQVASARAPSSPTVPACAPRRRSARGNRHRQRSSASQLSFGLPIDPRLFICRRPAHPQNASGLLDRQAKGERLTIGQRRCHRHCGHRAVVGPGERHDAGDGLSPDSTFGHRDRCDQGPVQSGRLEGHFGGPARQAGGSSTITR